MFFQYRDKVSFDQIVRDRPGGIEYHVFDLVIKEAWVCLCVLR